MPVALPALTRDEFVEMSAISYLALNKLEEFGLIQPWILEGSKGRGKYYSLQVLELMKLALRLVNERMMNLRDAYTEASKQLGL